MTVFVDDSATGANDGSDWNDAYTSINSADGAASAGEEIWVANTHSETLTSVALNFSNGTILDPVKVLSIAPSGASGGTLTRGATVQTTAADSGTHTLQLQGEAYFWGMDFLAADDITIGVNVTHWQYFENCVIGWNFDRGAGAVFNLGPGTSAIPARLFFKSCTWDQSARATWSAARLRRETIIEIDDLTIDPATTTNADLFDNITTNGSNYVTVRGSDLSDFTDICDGGNDYHITISQCEIASGAGISGTVSQDNTLVIENSTDGTLGNPSVPAFGLQHYEDYWGTIDMTTTQRRTGGADDGEQANEYSWNMTSSANTAELYSPLISPPMIRWVDAGASQTVRIYLAAAIAIQDDEFWIEVVSPMETAAPNTTAEGRWQTTRIDPIATPANLTADGSTWTGAGTTEEQRCDVTISPAVAGPVTVRCYLAKPSQTVYVDPFIDII
jgi:hypothetical protein